MYQVRLFAIELVRSLNVLHFRYAEATTSSFYGAPRNADALTSIGEWNAVAAAASDARSSARNCNCTRCSTASSRRG
jgi:hypothetical protein